MEHIIQARPVVAGEVQGRILLSSEPLSFWGGYDQKTGEIIDRRHPLSGQIARDRILALPFTRGSSTTTGVLLEAVRAGVAPKALLTTEIDTFFALAAIIAHELYGESLPVLTLDPEDFRALSSGEVVSIEQDGSIVREELVTD